MDINITLLAVIILTVLMLVRGFKRGLAEELSGLAALFAAFIVLAFAIMICSSIKEREMTNTIYSAILLVLFGVVYSVVKFVLRSVKAISSLPILNLLNSLLGGAIGICKSILIVWIVFLLYANNYLGSATAYIQRDIADNTALQLLYEYNFFIK